MQAANSTVRTRLLDHMTNEGRRVTRASDPPRTGPGISMAWANSTTENGVPIDQTAGINGKVHGSTGAGRLMHVTTPMSRLRYLEANVQLWR